MPIRCCFGGILQKYISATGFFYPSFFCCSAYSRLHLFHMANALFYLLNPTLRQMDEMDDGISRFFFYLCQKETNKLPVNLR